MDWAWLFDQGLIEGDLGLYERGELGDSDINHAIQVAYTGADDAQRRKLVDMAWASGKDMGGEKEYWYGDRSGEVADFAAAYSGVRPEGGDAPSATADVSYTGDEDITHVGLPGRPEVWQDSATGKAYVVYFVPGVEPELPMIWEVGKQEDLESFFGDDAVAYDRVGTMADFAAAGALDFGGADEIVLRGENPYAGWESQFEREAEVLPFLNDPEVAALMASAWMEGRQPTEAEMASAEWFKSKTGGEQQWLILAATQPETAKQLIESNKLAVRREMEAAGVLDPPQSAVDYMAKQWTEGLWTDEMKSNQVALMADPLKAGDRDTAFMDAMRGEDTTWDTTVGNEKYVRDELSRWLGPVYGQWTDGQVSEWAGRLRNDPDAKDALQTELSRQRQATLPEYENPDLTYEDIATPWRNMAFNSWGQQMDETSSTFQNMLKANDAAVSGQMLREEGLTQQIKQVEDNFMSDLNRSFGGSGGVRGYGG